MSELFSTRFITKETRRAMGCDFTLQISAPWPLEESVTARLFSGIRALESELSEFLSESGISRFNRALPGEKIQFSKAAFSAIERALELAQASDFAFNPFFRSHPAGLHVPLGAVLELNQDEHWVMKGKVPSHLSLGAFGKGFALDQVAQQLAVQGLEHFCLSASGSSLLISGWKAPGEPWLVSWEGMPGQLLRIPGGQRVAVGVSGTSGRGHHITAAKEKMTSLSEQTPAHQQRSLILIGYGGACAGDIDALSTAAYARLIGGHGSATSESWVQAVASRARVRASSLKLASTESPRRLLHASAQFITEHFPQLLFTTALYLAGPAGLAQETGATETSETIDLSAMDGGQPTSFAPDLGARHPAWVGLPLFGILLITLHLRRKKTRKAK